MIVFIGVDAETWHQATRDHLRLLRAEFEACDSQQQQYDVVLRAERFYKKEPETIDMAKDYKLSTKPRY